MTPIIFFITTLILIAFSREVADLIAEIFCRVSSVYQRITRSR
jgi:hypothetical protein